MKQSALTNTSENELAAIRQELNDLRPMREELSEMRRAFASLRGNGNVPCQRNGKSFLDMTESSVRTNRRGMLRKVGALAAGIAAASLFRPRSTRASGDANSITLAEGNITASNLTLFDAPVVVVDTRFGMGGERLASGATAEYAIGRITGTPVPFNAVAIIGRIANPNETGTSGSIFVAGINPPPAGSGVIGLTQGHIQNQFFTSTVEAKIDGAQSRVVLYVKNNTNGPTHIIIAVNGYYTS